MKNTIKPIKPRNPVARSPLLRKGGVHKQSSSGIRQSQKAVLDQSIQNWREELQLERQ